MRDRKPLYRSVNTRTRNVHHGGGDYRWSRNRKHEDPSRLGAMHGGKRHGRDYTPLFRFLLSRVGSDWAETHSEAVARLDSPDPIFWLVARSVQDRKPIVRVGESSYYSGLHVDEAGKLALVDPTLDIEDMRPDCACCTHSFDGVPFPHRFGKPWKRSSSSPAPWIRRAEALAGWRRYVRKRIAQRAAIARPLST